MDPPQTFKHQASLPFAPLTILGRESATRDWGHQETRVQLSAAHRICSGQVDAHAPCSSGQQKHRVLLGVGVKLVNKPLTLNT